MLRMPQAQRALTWIGQFKQVNGSQERMRFVVNDEFVGEDLLAMLVEQVCHKGFSATIVINIVLFLLLLLLLFLVRNGF